MANRLSKRNFLKEADFETEDLLYLIDLAAHLKQARKARREPRFLKGRNVALLFEKDSTRTRCAFEVGAREQGAHCTYIGPSGSQMGRKESMADTARVLSGFFDGIEYRGFGQKIVETLAHYASVPVWNRLTSEWHPPQFLADALTMRECAGGRPLNEITLAYLGDARFNMGNSLMVGCAKLGINFRSVAPRPLWTSEAVFQMAQGFAGKSGASIARTESVEEGVRGCDFLYTDVWVSMGEPDEVWKERIAMLEPYRVTGRVMDMTGKSGCRFLHCLPAFHNRKTAIGEQICQKYGIDCMEVNDEVFESPRNAAFLEAENRLHTIKAVMVATLAEESIEDAHARNGFSDRGQQVLGVRKKLSMTVQSDRGCRAP